MKNLAAALVEARKRFGIVKKDGDNPHFKSKFPTLLSALVATEEGLTANGLSVIQIPTQVNGFPALRTILLHTSGESIEDTMLLNPVKNDPQGVGSAITYARRYALMGLLNLAAEDDDGNAASSVSDRKETPRQRTQTATADRGEADKGEPAGDGGSPFKIPEKAMPKPRPVDGGDKVLSEDQRLQIEGLMDQVAAASGSNVAAVLAKAEKDYGPIPLMTEGAANQLIARFQKYLATAEKAEVK